MVEKNRSSAFWVRIAGIVAMTVVVGAASLGFVMRHRHVPSRPHVSVAPWDYPDMPNIHPVEHAGPPVPLPKSIVVAKDGVGMGPDCIKVRLISISKGNTENWEHWWDANGAPLSQSPYPYPTNIPDFAPRTDGRFRELRFEVSAPDSVQDDSYLGYVPDVVHQGLTPLEQPFHGWDIPQELRLGKMPVMQKAGVYVDDPSADKFLFGIAAGSWSTIDTAKCTFSMKMTKGQVVVTGSWGRLVAVGGIGRDQFIASAKSIPAIELQMVPPEDLYDQELRLKAYDAAGAEVAMMWSRQNRATIGFNVMTKIATVAIQARPYRYIEFADLHFDPEPSLWRQYVWGPNQPSVKVRVGEVTAELTAVSCSKPGEQDWNKNQYVFDKLYTPDGHIWRDHSTSYDGATGPMVEAAPSVDPRTGKISQPRPLPAPWIAHLQFQGLASGDSRPRGKVEVVGSNSDRPGEDVHEDWNLTPLHWNAYGQTRELPADGLWASFALKPHTTYAQFRFEIASGPWQKAAEIVPDPEDIKPQGPEYRLYTLEVGSKVHIAFRDPNRAPVDKPCSTPDLAGMETRTFARMKSGARIPLKITSYRQEVATSPLWSCYDLDRDATETEGDAIALPEVAAFEIESRKIQTGYLVFKLPKDLSKEDRTKP
ncbi:MAG: hypothetical protein P4L46_10455 [Fimbriimonas sp.]|nr:hypothetical protein [Fimbriimonas sp.]